MVLEAFTVSPCTLCFYNCFGDIVGLVYSVMNFPLTVIDRSMDTQIPNALDGLTVVKPFMSVCFQHHSVQRRALSRTYLA